MLELGSKYLKAGFAGEVCPQFMAPLTISFLLGATMHLFSGRLLIPFCRRLLGVCFQQRTGSILEGYCDFAISIWVARCSAETPREWNRCARQSRGSCAQSTSSTHQTEYYSRESAVSCRTDICNRTPASGELSSRPRCTFLVSCRYECFSCS